MLRVNNKKQLLNGGMMRRDFGHANNNFSHIGGHQNFGAPNYYSERGNQPIPQQRQQNQASLMGRFVVEEASEMVEFEAEFPELGNPELPIHAHRQEIKESVRNNQVTILVGETGSGKSTQVPQILLEDGYNVVLSQPRRMAARMVSERIGEELTGTLGAERAEGLVGYQTAEKSTIGDSTRISVVTDGIEALRQLHDGPAEDRVVHVVDEVHEWNTNIELSVAMIRQRLATDPNARFVLTSATMDAHRLAAYFAEATGVVPPVIEVPGRTHNIERVEKQNSTVLDEIVASATKNPDEDILVFLPGKREISDTIDALYRWLPADIKRTATILPLHAKLSPDEQDRVNQPTNGLKIILATNVAQTSLTIDGIDVVIDSGLERRVELDDEGVEGLRALPVSQADCDQRAGRTGRVGPGKYILTRYNADLDYVPYMNRAKYPVAEILRTDIDRTTLRAAAAGLDLAELKLFHPVDREVIERSKVALYNLGALDEHDVITTFGKKMNEFPVKPSSARMLMEALPFSAQIRAQVAAIVAAVEVGGLPYFAHDVGKAWQHLTEETSSDLLMQLDIFIAAQGKTDAELTDYDLDVQAVHRAQELYRKIMHRGHVGEVELAPPTAEERTAIERSVAAGLIDWVYQHTSDGNYQRVGGATDSVQRELSGRSIVHGRPKLVVGSPYRVEFMRGGERIERHIIEGVTALSDLRVLGRVAAQHLLSWVPDKQVWRDGRLKQVSQLMFNGAIRLGETKETDASNDPNVHATVRDSLLEYPGSAQRELRKIKVDLEELQYKTKTVVPQLTQDALLALLDEAMAAAGEYDQSRIDGALREIMVARGITIDAYMPAGERQQIKASSPDVITVDEDVHLAVVYRKGVPVVTKFTAADIAACPDDLQLSDGRKVMFWHGRHLLTAAEVRAVTTISSVQ